MPLTKRDLSQIRGVVHTEVETAVENLAAIVKKGFDDVSGRMATKEELREFQKLIVEEFNRVNADIHDVKIALGPLVSIAAAHDREIKELHFRVVRLERKAGISK